MPKSHPPYPSEFKARMIETIHADRTPEWLLCATKRAATTYQTLGGKSTEIRVICPFKRPTGPPEGCQI